MLPNVEGGVDDDDLRVEQPASLLDLERCGRGGVAGADAVAE